MLGLFQVLLSNKSALDKGEFYHFMRPLFGDGLIAADSNIWRRNRKIVAPALNALKVKSFTSVFVEGSEKLTDSWIKRVGRPFEPYTEVSKAAFGFTMSKLVHFVLLRLAGNKVQKNFDNSDLHNF